MKNIVIVGAGFGGVTCAYQLLKYKNCKVTLIDRRNYHLFQPLLYQVAMAGLNPSDISVPIRTLFRNKKNIDIILAEVEGLDLENKKIFFDNQILEYDFLVLACGAKHTYFGNDQWEEAAPGLKSIEQATEIRRRVLLAFENAEKENDLNIQKSYLSFVIVGGGPTGVEIAGAIAELAKHTLLKDYKNITSDKLNVVLVEGEKRLLKAFPEELSHKALEYLKKMGVKVLTSTKASDLSDKGLNLNGEFLAARTLIWSAGVLPSSLNQKINAPKDRLGRIKVNNNLTIPNYNNVFVIGDQMVFITPEGNELPGMAPVAIQQGYYVAKLIATDKIDSDAGFKYLDKGMMATIGRSRAVVATKWFNLSGFFAWAIWVFIHIIYLMKFKNKFFVFLQWTWSYFTFGRGARLITHKTWRFYSGEKIDLR